MATMCRVLKVARSGFYQWLHKPLSDRAIENERLLGLIRASYAASGGVYGAPRVFADLREVGERCGRHRVARLMRINTIRALRGYKKPRHIAGRPSVLAPNTLNRGFTVERPDQAWVTDITYLRTWQGWLYGLPRVSWTVPESGLSQMLGDRRLRVDFRPWGGLAECLSCEVAVNLHGSMEYAEDVDTLVSHDQVGDAVVAVLKDANLPTR